MTISSQTILFDPQLALEEGNRPVLLQSCTHSYSFRYFFSLSISHSLYSRENWYPEVKKNLSYIHFHLGTYICNFLSNFHLQSVMSLFKWVFLTLSADTGFPWQNRCWIKTDCFFKKMLLFNPERQTSNLINV